MAAASVRKGRLALIILAVLFLGPLILAYITYFSGWRPQGQVHNGHLVEPVLTVPKATVYDEQGSPLDVDPLRGERWTMLYVGASDCDDRCRRTLYNMRQVWKSLHRKAKRVQGVYIATDREQQSQLEAFVAGEHQGLSLVYAGPADDSGEGASEGASWQAFFNGEGGAPQGDNVYLIDPLGNWVLYYRPDDPPKGMLKDIKKLLRLSNIG